MASRICVIASPKYHATMSYAEALANTRGMSLLLPEYAAQLSLSRYDIFILADDPDSLGGDYLIHQFPGRVLGMSVSCDGRLMSQQLAAVKKKRLRGLVVPSWESYQSLGLSTEDVYYVPAHPDSLYPIALHGISCEDPQWLAIVSSLTKLKIPFTFIPPVDKSLLDSLEQFPAQFAVLANDQEDRAIFQANAVIYGEGLSRDRAVVKARAFGKSVLSSDSLADADVEAKIQEIASPKNDQGCMLECVEKDVAAQGDPVDRTYLFMGQQPPVTRMRKLLIKFPTKGRPEKFYDTFDRYAKMLSGRNDVTFLVTIDDNDETMPEAEVKDRLESRYTDYGIRVVIKSGVSTGKIHAVNRDMEDAPNFDVLLLASDDMIPVFPGYDNVILQAMEKHFPSTNGVLWFNDGYTGKKLNTLVCMGNVYYRQFGYIYHPDYTSLWCDNEFMRVANRLGRQAYINWTIICHEHPMNTQSVEKDALYDESEKWYTADEAVFKRRQATNFGNLPQRTLLSILIATLVKRRTLREALVAKIEDQIKELNAVGLVQIVIDEDQGEKSIGDKRTDLVKKADGEYVIFIDDDDDVADIAVESLVAALADGDVDCATFAGLIFQTDGSPKSFVHSLRHDHYWEDDKAYYRTPNHINAIKRSIALKHPFPGKNFSEDTDFASSVLPDLKSEKFIPQILYIYRPAEGGATSRAGVPLPPVAKPSGGQPLSSSTPITGPVKSVGRPLGRRRSAARTRKTRRMP
jgi:hypothetical protein